MFRLLSILFLLLSCDVSASSESDDLLTYRFTVNNIAFRPFRGTDADKQVFSEVMNDPEVAKHMLDGKPWGEVSGRLEKNYRWCAKCWEEFLSSGYDVNTISLTWIGATAEVESVARCGFSAYEPHLDGGSYISGLFLGIVPKYQRQGLAMALISKMQELFPTWFGMHQIRADANVTNGPSITLCPRQDLYSKVLSTRKSES